MKKFLSIVSVALVCGLGLVKASQAAEIIYLEGNVQVQSQDSEDWRAAVKGMKVEVGDSIRTARRSRADIALDADKKNVVRMESKALLVLNSNTANEVDRIDLSRGKIYSNLEGLKAGMDFEVSTPSAVAGVRGSAYSVYVERDSDEVQAYKDDVYLQSFDADKNMLVETTLPEGFKTMIERFEGPSSFIQVSEREFERFDRSSEEMSDNAAGRERTRAEREAARAEREAAAKAEREAAQGGGGTSGGTQSAIEKTSDDVSEQESIVKDLSDTKELTDENKADKNIEIFREITESGGHYN